MNDQLSNINEFKLSLIDKSLNEKLEVRAKLQGIIKYKKSKADNYNEEMACTIWLEWDVGNWLKENVRPGGSIITSRYNDMLPDGITLMQSSRWQMLSWIPEDILIEYIKTILPKDKKLTKKGVELFALRYKPKEDKGYNKPILYNEDYHDFLNRFEDKSVDLLLTDPPYSTEIDNIKGFISDWLPLALSKIKPTGRAYIFIGAYPIEIVNYLEYLLSRTDLIVDNPLIWTYRNTLGQTPSMKYNLNYQIILHIYSKDSHPLNKSITNEMFSVQDINAPDGRQGDRFYKWQKPEKLAKRLIRHSTKKDDTIIDCFACTGTFSLAGAELGRNILGCDISKKNLEIAKNRGCEIV